MAVADSARRCNGSQMGQVATVDEGAMKGKSGRLIVAGEVTSRRLDNERWQSSPCR